MKIQKFTHLLLALTAALALLCGSACTLLSPSGDEIAVQGIEAYEDERYETSIGYLNQALEIGVEEYTLDEIYTVLGQAHHQLAQYDQAIQAYQKGIEANSQNHQAWVGLGITYRSTDRYDNAEKSYRRALEINPDYAELHASLGVLLLAKGETKPAISALEKAVDLSPSLAVAHGNLALAYAIDGRIDEAEETLHEAIALGYKNWRNIEASIKNIKELGE